APDCTRISRRPWRAWKGPARPSPPTPRRRRSTRGSSAMSFAASANIPTRSWNGPGRSSNEDRNMALSRTEIVRGLQQLIGEANVVTDPEELKRSSIDRLRLYEDVHGVFSRPVPAAVVKARDTRQVAD